MKNIVKKIIAAVLLIALIACMTACASKVKATENKETAEEETDKIIGGWDAPDSIPHPLQDHPRHAGRIRHLRHRHHL